MELINRREPVPAKVLQIIRDGEVKSIDELYRYFNVTPLDSNFLYPRDSQKIVHYTRILDQMVFSLEKAGLVEICGDRLKPTELIQKVQQALDINLVELSSRTPETIYAQPLFGKPQKGGVAFDVFVLMPFTEELRPIYENHIKKVVSDNLAISIGRADDVFVASSIIYDIWNLIYKCKLLIADCTHRNPNVFYEIGVAHTIGKPVILIAQNIDDIPFDLRHIRAIIYSYTPPGMAKFESDIKKTVEAQISSLN